MKERPILFSSAMVRAILDGHKTMTRRVVKWVPIEIGMNTAFGGYSVGDYFTGNPESGKVLYHREAGRWQQKTKAIHCPYGQPGDQLWVRETFQPFWTTLDPGNWKTGEGYQISYPATDGVQEFFDEHKEETTNRCYPSIHMPRWASRITLEITKVRVERVQEISNSDAIAEGKDDLAAVPARCLFRDSWDAIYPGSWDRNDWVWVVEFKRVQ